jgi:hypothetical protein
LANRLTPDQRDKLALADKQRDVKSKLHASAKGRAAAVSIHSSGSKSKAQGFTTGGNKFDPLNATIP